MDIVDCLREKKKKRITQSEYVPIFLRDAVHVKGIQVFLQVLTNTKHLNAPVSPKIEQTSETLYWHVQKSLWGNYVIGY